MASIMKYITFRNCYNFLIFDFVQVPIFVILRELIFKTTQIPLMILQMLITYFLNFYIYTGYVKYSDIVDEGKFRKIMFLVIGIYFISFVLSNLHMPQKLSPSNYLNYLSPMPIAYVLMFYSFRLIRNEEKKFFRILSILNLCIFFIAIIGMISIPVITKNFTGSTKYIYFLPFVVGGFIVSIAELYWQVKLFRRLSSKYDEADRLSWN